MKLAVRKMKFKFVVVSLLGKRVFFLAVPLSVNETLDFFCIFLPVVTFCLFCFLKRLSPNLHTSKMVGRLKFSLCLATFLTTLSSYLLS